MQTYQELKKKQADEMNNFKGLFFAFSQEQFKEAIEKMGLSLDSKPQIISIGCGGYLLKTRESDFDNMLKRHKEEMKKLKKDNKEFLTALVYELRNHEFCITGDPTDALNALGFTASQVDPKILKEAIKQAR